MKSANAFHLSDAVFHAVDERRTGFRRFGQTDAQTAETILQSGPGVRIRRNGVFQNNFLPLRFDVEIIRFVEMLLVSAASEIQIHVAGNRAVFGLRPVLDNNRLARNRGEPGNADDFRTLIRGLRQLQTLRAAEKRRRRDNAHCLFVFRRIGGKIVSVFKIAVREKIVAEIRDFIQFEIADRDVSGWSRIDVEENFRILQSIRAEVKVERRIIRTRSPGGSRRLFS